MMLSRAAEGPCSCCEKVGPSGFRVHCRSLGVAVALILACSRLCAEDVVSDSLIDAAMIREDLAAAVVAVLAALVAAAAAGFVAFEVVQCSCLAAEYDSTSLDCFVAVAPSSDKEDIADGQLADGLREDRRDCESVGTVRDCSEAADLAADFHNWDIGPSESSFLGGNTETVVEGRVQACRLRAACEEVLGNFLAVAVALALVGRLLKPDSPSSCCSNFDLSVVVVAAAADFGQPMVEECLVASDCWKVSVAFEDFVVLKF